MPTGVPLAAPSATLLGVVPSLSMGADGATFITSIMNVRLEVMSSWLAWTVML